MVFRQLIQSHGKQTQNVIYAIKPQLSPFSKGEGNNKIITELKRSKTSLNK